MSRRMPVGSPPFFIRESMLHYAYNRSPCRSGSWDELGLPYNHQGRWMSQGFLIANLPIGQEVG